MKMELFLKHINQEMIDVKSDKKVIKDMEREIPTDIAGPASDWSVWGSWTVSCCIADFSMSLDLAERINPAPYIMIRKERDGGLIWNKRNQKVYQVDEDAYHTILEMDAGVCVRKIASKHRIDKMEVVKFARQLQEEFG